MSATPQDPGASAPERSLFVTKAPILLALGLGCLVLAFLVYAVWSRQQSAVLPDAGETVTAEQSRESLEAAERFLAKDARRRAPREPAPVPPERVAEPAVDLSAEERERDRRRAERVQQARQAGTGIDTSQLYQRERAARRDPAATGRAGQPFPAPLAGPGRNRDEIDPNLRRRKDAFVKTTRTFGYSTEGVTAPLSPYELRVGHLIPSVLIGGIDSDLPGLVVGQVRRPVRDTATGRHVLIPAGTRVIGQYDSHVAFGQQRVLVGWHRLQFPNGATMALGSMPGTDPAGMAGFHDQVDNHYFRTFASATLISILGAGAQLAMPDRKKTREPVTTTGDIIAEQLASQWNQVGQEILRRNLNVQPTLTIRPGYRFNIVVEKDLIFEAPYRG